MSDVAHSQDSMDASVIPVSQHRVAQVAHGVRSNLKWIALAEIEDVPVLSADIIRPTGLQFPRQGSARNYPRDTSEAETPVRSHLMATAGQSRSVTNRHAHDWRTD